MLDAVSTASNLQNNAAQSSQSLSDNFDTFLLLLTAQLENQDPLEPVDSTEFTNQLVQFSGVEQQIATNSALADLITITANSTAAGLSGYLGRVADIDSATGSLSSSGLEWVYDLPEGVSQAVLSIQSPEGRIVHSENAAAEAGRQTFNWDGSLASGGKLADGNYTLLVSAQDAAGETIAVPISLRSRVNGVDLSSGTTAISTDSGNFDFGRVLRLTE